MAETAVTTQVVVLGVDTHQQTHHAAIVATDGRPLADREFPTTTAGYTQLWQWACGFGRVEDAAVESSASYGAGLTRMLTAEGVRVIEVNTPDLPRRYAHGKTDQLDAYAAAMAAITGRATALSGAFTLAIGLALTLIHMISIPISNTSVNPARSTAVAFFLVASLNQAG